MNETLELIDRLRSLELEEAFASATGCVHDSLMSELQDLARLIQYHWTQHVEPNRGQQSHTRDVLLVLMDWDSSSLWYVLKEFPSIKQLRVAVQNQLIAEGVRVSEVISSSTGTAAIEQATSKYQAFEGACVLNASTWHQADHELIVFGRCSR